MKRALLVGINSYPSAPLNGCVNDVSDMASFLLNACGFRMDDIRLLTDSRATKDAIVKRLGWLLTGLRSGDQIVFLYSGHGAQMATRNPQGEVDGLDEVICPVDFDWSDEHAIRDKDFNRIFSAIPDGVNFVWLSDSCHSGDLTKELPESSHQTSSHQTSSHHTARWLTPPADFAWRLKTAKAKKLEAKGLARTAAGLNLVFLSGCRDNQTSEDAVFNGRYNGAFTYFLLHSLSSSGGLAMPMGKLIHSVQSELKRNKYSQVPQIEGPAPLIQEPFLGI